MIIEKKAWPGIFQDVLEGKKKFDVRVADFDCNVGDLLVLREWNPETGNYTGREIKKEINYVIKTKEMPFFEESDIDAHGLIVVSFD